MVFGRRNTTASVIDGIELFGDTFDGNNELPRVRNVRSKRRSKKTRSVGRRSRRKVSSSRKRRVQARRSSGKIKYTKKGQPYKIMQNGRARFIKKRGSR